MEVGVERQVACPAVLGHPRDETQLVADRVEGLERLVELGVGVGRGDDRAQARLVDGDGREDDRLGEDALLDQPLRESAGRVGVAHHDRRDRRLGAAGVEAEARRAPP